MECREPLTPPPRVALRVAGFTLTELVLVIVLAGILSAVAYNKIDVATFKAEGTTDQVKAAVRYAHKLAVAQRKEVYISATGSTVSLCYDAGCSKAVVTPGEGGGFSLTASGSVTLSDAFYFDKLGRPNLTAGGLASAAITLSIAGGSRTITIEPQTGFVH